MIIIISLLLLLLLLLYSEVDTYHVISGSLYLWNWLVRFAR